MTEDIKNQIIDKVLCRLSITKNEFENIKSKALIDYSSNLKGRLPILDLITGKIYTTIREASKDLGLGYSNLRQNIKLGKTNFIYL